jgi:hypothetical protein
VNTGEPNTGAFPPSVSVVAMSPFPAEADQAVIRKVMVPPGGTLAADAETITWGLAEVGREGGEEVAVGAPLGVGVGLVVEGDGAGEPCDREARGRWVALGAGVDAADGLDDADGVDDAGGPDVIDGLDVAHRVLGPADGVPADGVPADGVPADGVPADGVPADGVPADGVLGAAEGDDAAEAGGAAVRTMPATPLEMTKRPVARPSVIGRRYGDRMEHLVCGS